jgi:competence ComEA-like helix-hairpin-helix protein
MSARLKVRVRIDWLRHDGERRQPGDEIEVDGAAADLLIAQDAVELVAKSRKVGLTDQGTGESQADQDAGGDAVTDEAGGDAETAQAERDENGTVRLNHASAETLRSVRGLGAQLADAIVARRRKQGPFLTIDDLLELPGIGPKNLPALAYQLTCI